MTAILFATLVWQVIDFLRELTNLPATRSSVVTQACAWVGGIILVALGSHAAVTAALTLPGLSMPLGDLDGSSIVLVGLLVSSLASSLVDTTQAIDQHNTPKVPPLIGPPAG